MRRSSIHPRFLRFLDSFEEMFWTLERVTSRSHALAGELDRAFSPAEWTRAFHVVQQRYPRLRASIGKRPGERPFFYDVPDRKIPVEFREMEPDLCLEKTVEQELLRSFGPDTPLTRAVIFLADQRCAFLLLSHHAALDGRSHLILIRDLLAVLTGAELGGIQDMTPSTSELYGHPVLPYSRLLESAHDDAPTPAVHATFPVHIQRHAMPAREIVSAARSRGVTVHSALLVALAQAGTQLSDEWRDRDVRALSPVDVRPRLGLGDALGLLITLHVRRINLWNGQSFWALAREVSRSLRADALHHASLASLAQADALAMDEHSPMSYIRALADSEFLVDLMLTNYGVCDVAPENAPFAVSNVFTAGLGGSPVAQKVAVMTFDSELHMTLVSQYPISGLLETTRDILYHAAKDAIVDGDAAIRQHRALDTRAEPLKI